MAALLTGVSWLRSLIVLLAALVLLGPASAEKRVALVIGNAGYANVPELKSTLRDAAAMAALFRSAGFDRVDLADNLAAAPFREALDRFSGAVHDADIAVVYFAGHGIELNGQNYLVPTDAVLARDVDVSGEAISLDSVLRAVAGARRLKLVILDACRENPFARRMETTQDAAGPRASGLARVAPTLSQTLIAYAAKAGTVANDGEEGLSPFAAALVQHLPAPGLDVRLALGRVRDAVMRETTDEGHPQEPFTYGSLGGSEVSLVPGTSHSAPPADAAFLESATDPKLLEALIAQFPASPLRPKWEARLRTLAGTELAALPPGAGPGEASKHLFVIPEGATLVPRPTTDNGVETLAFSADGRLVLAGSKNIDVWDLASGRRLRSFGAGTSPHSLAVAADGRTAVSAHGDRLVRVWDVAGGLLIRALEGHADVVNAVAIAPDAATVLSGSVDRTVRVWALRSGRLLRTLREHKGYVYSVAFSPDGKKAVSASADKSLKIWDVPSWSSLRTIHAGTVQSAVFSPDGRSVLAGNEEGALALWGAADGRRRAFEGRNEPIMSVAISADGRHALSGGYDQNLKLWDVTSGRLLRTFQGHTSAVQATAFGPDGLTAASGSLDGTVKLWELSTGRCLATFMADGANWLVLLPDGRFAAAGDPTKFLLLVRGSETLPLDEFWRINRRDAVSLAR